jgi:hypothetical protein
MNGAYTDKATGFGSLPWKKRVPLFDTEQKSSMSCSIRAEETEGISRSASISRDAEDMLVKAKRKPYLTMTNLYKEVGLSGYKGLKCKQELIRAGLADEVQLPTNRRGRRKKLLQIMPKGTEYLKTLGITRESRGRGGVKHIYYQVKLKEWYQARGYTVEIEATVGDTCVDVLVILKDGKRLGIEIALSEQYEQVNALKALGAGIERLLFVCEDHTLMGRLKQKINSAIGHGAKLQPGFKLISDYL